MERAQLFNEMYTRLHYLTKFCPLIKGYKKTGLVRDAKHEEMREWLREHMPKIKALCYKTQPLVYLVKSKNGKLEILLKPKKK